MCACRYHSPERAVGGRRYEGATEHAELEGLLDRPPAGPSPGVQTALERLSSPSRMRAVAEGGERRQLSAAAAAAQAEPPPQNITLHPAAAPPPPTTVQVAAGGGRGLTAPLFASPAVAQGVAAEPRSPPAALRNVNIALASPTVRRLASQLVNMKEEGHEDGESRSASPTHSQQRGLPYGRGVSGGALDDDAAWLAKMRATYGLQEEGTPAQPPAALRVVAAGGQQGAEHAAPASVAGSAQHSPNVVRCLRSPARGTGLQQQWNLGGVSGALRQLSVSEVLDRS